LTLATNDTAQATEGVDGAIVQLTKSSVELEAAGNVTKNLESQKKIQDEMTKTMEIAKKMGVDVNAALGTGVPNLPKYKDVDKDATKKAEKDKHELDQEKKKLENLQELLKTFQNDVKQLNGSHDESEAIKIKEKYDKAIHDAEEFHKSKHPQVVKEGREIIAKLNTLRDDELLAIQNKHLREVQEFIKQHQEDVAAAQISDDEKALQHIKNKYDKEFAKIIELEAKNVQGAHDTRTQLEALLEAELEAERVKQRAKADEQEIADNEKQLQTRLKEEHDYATFTGNLQQEELHQLEVHYLNILQLAEKNKQDVTAVNEAYTKKQKQINDKYNKEKLKGEKETTELIKKAQVDLKLAKISALQEGAAILRGMVGENTALGKALFVFEKAMAVSGILVNLAKEKSAINMHAATMGPAGAAYSAVQNTVASIRAGINVASVVGQTVAHFSAPQKFDGGYHDVQGQTDGRIYRARYIGARPTGMLPSHPSIVLASELGAEYYVNHDALSIPQVDWHVKAIDNIVNNRPPKLKQFKDGGYDGDANVNSSNNITDLSQVNNTMVRMNALLEQLLVQGIQAQAIIGWAQIKDLKQAFERLANIEK
jgi:hypothetical protein